MSEDGPSKCMCIFHRLQGYQKLVIRIISRTNSWAMRTHTCKSINHFSNPPVNQLASKIPIDAACFTFEYKIKLSRFQIWQLSNVQSFLQTMHDFAKFLYERGNHKSFNSSIFQNAFLLKITIIRAPVRSWARLEFSLRQTASTIDHGYWMFWLSSQMLKVYVTSYKKYWMFSQSEMKSVLRNSL